MARAAIVPRVRVDRDDGDPLGRRAGEHRGRTASVAADLDDRGGGDQLTRPVPQAARLIVGHPTVDVAHGARASPRTRRQRTASSSQTRRQRITQFQHTNSRSTGILVRNDAHDQ